MMVALIKLGYKTSEFQFAGKRHNIPVSVLFENINYRRRVYPVAIIKFLNIQFIPIISVYHLRQTNFENDNFTCFYFLNNLSL